MIAATFAPASAPYPLVVYDGQVRVGHLIRHDSEFEAIDNNGVSYGVHADMKTAAFSLPKRSAS